MMGGPAVSEMETTTTTVSPATTEPAAPEAPKSVPLSELQKERKARKDLEARLEQFERDAEERRKSEMSEAERWKTEADKLKAEADSARREATSVRREQWLRRAAEKQGFIDPQDAVARIGTADIDDERAAADAVKALKSEAPHLLQDSRPKEPRLEKVLENGARPDGNAPDELLTREQLQAMSQTEIQEKWDLVSRSMAALPN